MTESVKLVVDAMGGDDAPDVVLEGVSSALAENPDIEIYLCGTPDVVEPFASSYDRCIAVPATEVIGMADHPVEAIKQKKDSSIVVGCDLVKKGVAQGLFSAGSTGACLAAATLIIGRIKGIKRPALGVVLPAYKKPVFLLDVGANADCKPDYLPQFAKMGEIYMSNILGVASPIVGLLNIGEEDTKGSVFAQEAHRLLKEELPSFGGNCEGGDLVEGDFDVVVTDGFTGNVCLKTIEGTSKLMLRYVKDALTSSTTAKIGAALVKGKLSDLKDDIDPDKYGGSPLLGIKGTCIIGHGSSNAKAIKNGIMAGYNAIKADLSGLIEESLRSDSSTDGILK